MAYDLRRYRGFQLIYEQRVIVLIHLMLQLQVSWQHILPFEGTTFEGMYMNNLDHKLWNFEELLCFNLWTFVGAVISLAVNLMLLARKTSEVFRQVRSPQHPLLPQHQIRVPLHSIGPVSDPRL
ncbi:hypothetical protein PTKIN_Ptkin09bG0236600 [Pterospermum kingtungense]